MCANKWPKNATESQQVGQICRKVSEKIANSVKMHTQSCNFEVFGVAFSRKVCKMFVLLRTHYLLGFCNKTLPGAARGCSLRASSGALAALGSLTWQFCVFDGAPEPPRDVIWRPRVRQSLHKGASKAPPSCHDASKTFPKSSPWDHRASKWGPMALEVPP